MSGTISIEMVMNVSRTSKNSDQDKTNMAYSKPECIMLLIYHSSFVSQARDWHKLK